MAKKKTRRDTVEVARSIVEQAIGERLNGGPLPPGEPVYTSSTKRGRAGGLKGGKARSDKLTPKQRSRIARKAARARWSKGR